jgi:hypothetical protein
MYGSFRVSATTRAVPTLHRVVGVAALLLTIPIAYHCAFAYGVQTHVGSRVAVHSLAGCFFYGAFAAKVAIVRSRRFRGWAMPLAGGTLVTLVACSGTRAPSGTSTTTPCPFSEPAGSGAGCATGAQLRGVLSARS